MHPDIRRAWLAICLALATPAPFASDAAGAVSAETPPQESAIVVKVTGIRHKRGPTLDLMLYASEQDKDADNALVRKKATLQPGATEHTFVVAGVPPGRYMILGAQDANGNGELDSSFIGIPKEGYFSTNDKRMPSWKECSFDYDGKSLSLQVSMVYW